MVPNGHKYICGDLRTSFTRFEHIMDISHDFHQKIQKTSSYCLCCYPLWESLVNRGKTCKIIIFDSKITLMVFYTPTNTARDRLDLYCDFPNDR